MSWFGLSKSNRYKIATLWMLMLGLGAPQHVVTGGVTLRGTRTLVRLSKSDFYILVTVVYLNILVVCRVNCV